MKAPMLGVGADMDRVTQTTNEGTDVNTLLHLSGCMVPTHESGVHTSAAPTWAVMFARILAPWWSVAR